MFRLFRSAFRYFFGGIFIATFALLLLSAVIDLATGDLQTSDFFLIIGIFSVILAWPGIWLIRKERRDRIEETGEPISAQPLNQTDDEKSQKENAGADDSNILNIGRATYGELLELPGIGAAAARLILKRRRETGGPFTVQELTQLIDLKPHVAEKLSKRISFPDTTQEQCFRSPDVAKASPKGQLKGRVID
jgi:hypothetical protein